ncbi:hypothetical protein AFR_35745 [Actinoplanes friuliensis DSM 7358]|uniref:Uncharacterized protein n=2 Tax=Actinoplanes friuliensis TaxID=196914 RepID=U5WBM7_9ACTN|nr:hypothetical protein AFR_35745 [Actinoplanes friuliensis DSM 7358]
MGYSLDAWLALGPDPALAVLRSFPVWEPDEWQLESSCEAGALLDLDTRELLFYLDLDYERRAALLDGYGATWPGWQIRWAYNGISDVTDALGLPSTVLEHEPWDSTDLYRWGRAAADEEPIVRYLVTVGEVAYALDPYAGQPWQVGPALLEQLTDGHRVTGWPEVPRGGLHLDPGSRTAGIWCIEPVLGVAERFAGRWPGWTLQWWEDRYDEQERRAGGTFVPPELGAGRFELAERVQDHWVYATAEMSGHWPEFRNDYGTRDAGLTVDELQRGCDLLSGPEGDRVDVGAEAAKLRRWR